VTAIFFVEDDPGSRRNIALFLRRSGYEVCEAEDGETALSLLSQRHFDVVMSDFSLPGQLDGIDILDAAKTSARRILPLLITGYSSNYQTAGGFLRRCLL
jgi:DNA-binding NtrC family response regulator